jgi:hypothetical protein
LLLIHALRDLWHRAPKELGDNSKLLRALVINLANTPGSLIHPC